MSDLWQQAQEAVRDGNNERAHLLLANLLRQERDNVAAWYLLSTIVPSQDQEEVFLKRVLKLSPGHFQAQTRLVELEADPPQAPPSVPISERGPAPEGASSSQPEINLASPPEEDKVPDWLIQDAGLALDADEATDVDDILGDMDASIEEEIPDWLRDMPQGDSISDEVQGLAPLQAAADRAAAQRSSRRPARNQPSPVLLGLIAVSAIVFILLIYFIITLGPSLFS